MRGPLGWLQAVVAATLMVLRSMLGVRASMSAIVRYQYYDPSLIIHLDRAKTRPVAALHACTLECAAIPIEGGSHSLLLRVSLLLGRLLVLRGSPFHSLRTPSTP